MSIIKNVFSFILGLLALPLTYRIFKILSLNLAGNEGTVMIIFFIVFSLITLGIFFILRKMFGFLFFIGLITGLILIYKGII